MHNYGINRAIVSVLNYPAPPPVVVVFDSIVEERKIPEILHETPSNCIFIKLLPLLKYRMKCCILQAATLIIIYGLLLNTNRKMNTVLKSFKLVS